MAHSEAPPQKLTETSLENDQRTDMVGRDTKMAILKMPRERRKMWGQPRN